MGDVGLRGGVGVFDVQMLYGRVGDSQQLLLIDLTEGRVLDEVSERDAASVARAFVAEVCSLLSSEAQADAAQALLQVLRVARADGVRPNPALAAALAEPPLPLAPAAVQEAIAVEAMGFLDSGLGGGAGVGAGVVEDVK